MSSISPCLTGRSRSTTSYESRVGVSSSTSRANFATSPPDAARSMSLLAELSPRARDPKSMTLHTPFRLARVRMLSMTFCLRSIVSALSLWGRRSAPRTILSIGHTFHGHLFRLPVPVRVELRPRAAFAVCARAVDEKSPGRALRSGLGFKRMQSWACGYSPSSPKSTLVMSAAAFLPAPMARMTVAAPVTMSPPAQILGLEVRPVSSSATM